MEISLDGVANDGRPGEGDDIRALESFSAGAISRFSGDDEANTFYAPEKGRAAVLLGFGGNDMLHGGDAHGDQLDGGAGDDELSGGMGSDSLTGGPGRDVIAGDRVARCNELHCDITQGFGDDTIDARDGEVDHVQCGPGTDTVLADKIDVVATDCEIGRPQGDGKTPNGGTPAANGLTLTSGTSLRLTGGKRRVTIATAAKGKVSVTVKAGKTTIAQGSAKPSGGKAQVTLKLTKVGKQKLKRGTRKGKLTVRQGKAQLVASVKLR